MKCVGCGYDGRLPALSRCIACYLDYMRAAGRAVVRGATTGLVLLALGACAVLCGAAAGT